MKKIFLLLTILTISFACKKQSVEPAPEEPEPIKTSKSFTARITYYQDSTTTYTYGNISFTLDTIPVLTPNWFFNHQTGWSGAFTNGITVTSAKINYTTLNVNKPMKVYIHMNITRFRCYGVGCPTIPNNLSYRNYIKEYTFNEGDNGTIHFNTLP
jgi:hypothetical protein